MTTRQWILLLICGCAIAALVGCGGGSSSGGGGGGGSNPISVSFSTAPPSWLQVSKTAPVAATVANDSSNKGVDWSCTPASACGSLNPTHTASGAATTYTAPAAVPSGGKVKITAASTSDNTKSVAGSVTISTIAFSQAPPKSLQTNSKANVAATVASDSQQNGGVDWTCTPANSCGSFNPAHTASGVATSYTAPSSVPSGNKVTITATSTAYNTESVPASVTIIGGNSGISVSFSPPPPNSMQINTQAQVGATVTNDNSNAGVDWSCVPIGSCGSFSPTHTASGVETTYTAPSQIPVHHAVTITATSTADNSKFVSAYVPITGNSPIVVVFDPQPSPFFIVNNGSTMTALVANDSSNSGVDWSCTPSSTCGSFNPTHTASGVATTYTAPASAANVVITAASTKNSSSYDSANVTIATSFGKAALFGNYVFAVSGRDSFPDINQKGIPPAAYQVAGVFAADGNGNITGGEQIYSDQPQVATDQISPTGSSYAIGSDGRGTIALNTGDTSIGVNGVETFSVVLLGGTQGSITQFDASASSSGTLDLQTTFSKNNVLSGGYAFVTSGVEFAYTKAPLGIGGVFNVDGANTISGAGSVVDINDNGTLSTGVQLAANQSTVASPDQFGKVVVNLTLSTGAPLTYVGFIVDDTHVKLVEKDRETNAIYGTTGGVAYAQGASTGTFTKASFNTTVVYSALGYSTVGTNPPIPLQPTAYAGVFTADGAGSITNGYTDLNQFGTLISDTLTGSYSVDSNKTGRVTTSVFYGMGGQGPSWIFYLTGASDVSALILQVDGTSKTSPDFIETIGTAYTQTSGASFNNAPYGMGFAYFPLFSQSGGKTGIGEDDGTGQVQSDGASNLTSGHEDLNTCNIDFTTGLCLSFTPSANLPLSGTFGTSGVPGRLMGTLNDGAVFNSDPIVFYVADGTRVLFIDMGGQPALGVFRQQQ